jgi:Nif-specific regulatory protein
MKANPHSPHSVIDRFVTLLDICQRINSEKNFDELLSIIAGEAAKLVDAERATIFLLDPDAKELWAKVALGTEEIIRFDARLGIAGAVIKTGKTMNVEDAYNSPLFYTAIDNITGFQTRNILCVPIRNYRREIIGVFQVLNKRDGRFSPEDDQFVDALASQAAVALENARQVMALEQKQQELLAENESLRQEVQGRFSSKNILGTAAKIDRIRELLDKVAATTVSVLITGENGTGKELAARAIHYGGPRRSKAFVAVNCAALPETLVEAELFGIEKGVATGVDRRVGRIQSASGGTLFLDEIGDLSVPAQAKLLRVLQEREVEWVGGRKPVPVDVRLIAATNKDLPREIKEGNFRQDLYFRLNIVHLTMPSLREIRGDIPVLATYFLQRYGHETGGRSRGFSQAALKSLTAYDWPGNVRQLENEVKRAMVLSSGELIEPDDLSDEVREGGVWTPSSESASPVSADSKKPLKDRVAALEMELIRDAMADTEGDRRRAAKLLGLSHQGLINKINRYGLA